MSVEMNGVLYGVLLKCSGCVPVRRTRYIEVHGTIRMMSRHGKSKHTVQDTVRYYYNKYTVYCRIQNNTIRFLKVKLVVCTINNKL